MMTELSTSSRSSVAARIAKLGSLETHTQIVVAASGGVPPNDPHCPAVWIPADGLGTERLCVLYWGERPAYALVAGEPSDSGEATLFHTADRGVVEQLSQQLRRDLAGVPDVEATGGAA